MSHDQHWQTVGQWEEFEEKGKQPPVMAVFKKENEMGFLASDAGPSGNFKKVPSGNFMARCYSIIDLGTQFTDGQYGAKYQHKIQLRWELFGEDENDKSLQIDVDGKDMPLTIAKKYTLSLHEKSSLRRDLASWRGKDFTDNETKCFDVAKLLGAYCMINVTVTETNGKSYSNVASITPIPGQLKNLKPAPVHTNIKFDLDAPDMELFKGFHEKLQEVIALSPEWQNSIGNADITNTDKDIAKPKVAEGSGFDDMDDDIPFN